MRGFERQAGTLRFFEAIPGDFPSDSERLGATRSDGEILRVSVVRSAVELGAIVQFYA